MTITAAIITNHVISQTGPVDCLLDAMITAQKTLGQIIWDHITMDSAHGTYRDAAGQTTVVSVIDTSAGVLQGAVKDWMAA